MLPLMVRVDMLAYVIQRYIDVDRRAWLGVFSSGHDHMSPLQLPAAG